MIPEALTGEYPFDEHYLQVGDHRYHYVDEGQGPVLLMLHGNPTWSFYYRRLILGLRDEFRVIAPDHLGCGLSDKPQDYDYCLANHIANVQQLIDHLELERFTLVMHDWGGPIGLGVATAAPERIDRLVVFNTTCKLDADYPWQIRLMRLPLLGPVMIRGLNAFCRTAARLCATRRPLSATARAGLLYPYDSWAHRVAVMRFVQDIPLEPGHRTRAVGQRISAGLPALSHKPAMICWGMRDFCFTPAFLQPWEELLPQAEVHRIEDAGHYVVEDAHEEILPWVRGFLERQTTAQEK